MIVGVDYTGISVGFICHDGQGNILLHKRSKHTRDQQGRWDWGGGKLEYGETIEEALSREMKEEYNIYNPTIEHSFPAIEYFNNQDGIKTHWIVLIHVVKVNVAEVRNNESRSIDEIGWFTLDNLPQPMHTGCTKDLEIFGEELKKYINKK